MSVGSITCSANVGSYTNPLNTNRVDVVYDFDRGLYARSHEIDDRGEVIRTQEGLRLVGMPTRALRERDLRQLQTYFSHTHLIPERGIDGVCNRVAVHVTGLGGGRSKIPFQPGLALGSVFRCETLDQMEKYATAQAEIQRYEELGRAAEEEAEALQSKIKYRTEVEGKKADDKLVETWTALKGKLETKSGEYYQKAFDLADKDIPDFAAFYAALESPIDEGRSTIDIQVRGFDSMSFNSQFFTKTDSPEHIEDSIRRSARSSSASGSIGGGWGPFKGSGSASVSSSSATAKRVSEINARTDSLGVLVLSAYISTRYVRSYTDLKFDESKLNTFLSILDNKSISDEEKERYGISGDRIYVLTEAVLGGSYTALVTFKKVEDASRKALMEHCEGSFSASASIRAKAGWGPWSVSGGKSLSTAHSWGSQKEDDLLVSMASTKIDIEFVAHGALPHFERQTIEQEIMKHAHLDPSKYEPSQSDIKDAEDMVSTDKQKQSMANQRRVMKMENSQTASMNAIRGLAATKESHSVHTIESVYQAFESFNRKVCEDKNCGVPIGFKYRIYTKDDLLYEYHKLTGKHWTSGTHGRATGNTAADAAKG